MQHIRHSSSLGQAHTVANPENNARVENAMHKDKHLEHSLESNMSNSTAHAIVQDFEYHKISSQGVPCLLTCKYKKQRKSISLEYLQQNHTEHNTFLACFVTRMRQGASILCPHKTRRHAMETFHFTPTQEIQVPNISH